MTKLRYIDTEAQWEALPVGTLARVGYIEHDENGNEIDEGKVMTMLRVDGDFRANVGDYMLAGGKYWTEVWGWEQGAHAVDTATIADEDTPRAAPLEAAEATVDAAITAHQARLDALNAMPVSEYRKLREDDLPPDSPAGTIIEALTAVGWAAPPVYPEGVQVWTISGIPDGGRADGTQAYLSLPGRTDEHRFDFQDRGDIWLDKPSVSVNFELPSRNA